MALSEKKIQKIRADIEAGLLSKTDIANKHKINRLTLYNIIERDELVYAKNKQAITETVAQKTLEQIVEKEIDRAVKITNQFLNDLDKYRQLAMYPASEVARAIKQAGPNGKVPKNEYDRIFSGAKINKISMEALNVGYSGARKALGMDRDDDVEKAKRIKGAEAQPILDPADNLTEEEIDKQIEELQ